MNSFLKANKKFLGAAIFLATVFGVAAQSVLFGNTGAVKGPHIVILEPEYDFGVVLQSGGTVSKDFIVKNDGTESVVVSEVLTSCSCTTATIEPRTIQPQEQAVLRVTFDPNFHFEDSGRFFRTASIKSNSLGTAPEAKIFVEVNYDLGMDALKFK